MLDGLDDSVRGSKALAGLLKVPVLAVIPYIENDEQIRRKWKIGRIAAALSIAALVLAALFVHSFLIPLDVLWFRGLRKLQMYAPEVATISRSQLEIVRFIWSA